MLLGLIQLDTWHRISPGPYKRRLNSIEINYPCKTPTVSFLIIICHRMASKHRPHMAYLAAAGPHQLQWRGNQWDCPVARVTQASVGQTLHSFYSSGTRYMFLSHQVAGRGLSVKVRWRFTLFARVQPYLHDPQALFTNQCHLTRYFLQSARYHSQYPPNILAPDPSLW